MRRTGFKRLTYQEKLDRLRVKRGKKPSRIARRKLKAKRDPKLLAWSRAIKKRDKFCQWPLCPYRGQAVTLDAHHKAPRSLRPDLRLDLQNGIALCRYHHEHAHHEGRAEAITLGILITETYEKAQKAA